MKRKTKRSLVSISGLVLILAVMLLFCLTLAKADDEPCEVYIFEMVPTPTPQPPRREMFYNEYEWSQAEIDELAGIYWAECNTDEEKLAVTQLIFNRVSHGAPFKSTLVEAMHQKGEFNHGRVSDANREKAEYNLNRVYTQSEGLYSGVDVPTSAVYMSRSGKTLIFYDINWNVVWRK